MRPDIREQQIIVDQRHTELRAEAAAAMRASKPDAKRRFAGLQMRRSERPRS